MKKVLTFLFLVFSFASVAQTDTLTATQAKEYLTKEVTVKAKVVGTRLFDKNNRKTLLINLDIPYPQTPLTIVIFDALFNEFDKKWKSDKLEGKDVIIKGIVTLYNGKPQIVLNDLKNFIISE